MSTVTSVKRLTTGDIERLHQATLEILRDVGVAFHHPEALRILRDRGIRVDGRTAFFHPEQVMRWIARAPAEFTLHARNPDHDMRIGGDRIWFAPGYGAPVVVDPDGTRRRGCLQDYLTFVRLFHQSPLFHLNGGILVQPGDVPAGHATILMHLAALTHSDKCLLAIPAETAVNQTTLEMLATCFGGREALAQRPRAIVLVNTLSPLGLDHQGLATVLAYARAGQPIIVTPGVMAGATGPVTLAGTLVQANAEALAGIALAQMVRPGTPVVYGCQSTAADMRTGAYAIGGPEHALCVATGARLARYYGLPCRGGGAPTDATAVSVQAGYEAMFVMMATCTSGVNLVLHTAGILDAHGAMSVEKAVVDCEIAAMAARYAAGLELDDTDLALEVIRQVGPGGEYLTHDHTLAHCRQALWIPSIGGRGQHRTPLADAVRAVRDRLLAGYRCPALPEEHLAGLAALLSARGIDPAWLTAAGGPGWSAVSTNAPCTGGRP